MEKKKIYSSQLKKVKRPDRLKIIINALDEEIMEAKRKGVLV